MASRIDASASGVCARSRAAARTVPVMIASKGASADVTRQILRDLGYGCRPEAGRVEAAFTLGRIAEQEEVGAGRQGNIHAAMGLHRTVDDAEANRLLWRCPDAEGNAAAASEHAQPLTEERVRIGEMRHAEVADDGIEAAVRKGERTGSLSDLTVWRNFQLIRCRILEDNFNYRSKKRMVISISDP